VTPNHQRIIDSALLALHSQTLELVVMINFQSDTHQEQEQERLRDRLRKSMAAYHMTDIAHFAEGEDIAPERAQEAINALYKLFFRGVYRNDLIPPADFSKTEIGQLINEAYLRMIHGEELLTPTAAYQQLKVTRRVVYNYIESGKLQAVYVNGHPMLLARQVEEIKSQRKQPVAK